jgi:hypothetical protein
MLQAKRSSAIATAESRTLITICARHHFGRLGLHLDGRIPAGMQHGAQQRCDDVPEAQTTMPRRP